MSGRSEAYQQGFSSKIYENPYPINSQEYNDFERGWSQKIKRSSVGRTPKAYEKALIQKHKESLKNTKSQIQVNSGYNPYAEAKGK